MGFLVLFSFKYQSAISFIDLIIHNKIFVSLKYNDYHPSDGATISMDVFGLRYFEYTINEWEKSMNAIAVVYTTYFNEINEKSVFHTYKVKVVP